MNAERKVDLTLGLRLLWDNTTAFVFMLTGDGWIVAANPAACDAYGYSAEEIKRLHIRQLRSEEEQDVVDQQLRQAARSIHFETIHRRKDGATFPVEVRSSRTMVNGEAYILSIVTDITSRRRTEATSNLLRQIDHEILQRKPLQQTLDQMCERLVEIYRYTAAWVGLNEPGGTVRILARGGRNEGLLDGLTIRWDEGVFSVGPTGTAIREGQPQLRDFAADDPSLVAWRGRVTTCGLRRGLSIPLVAHSRSLGAITFYASRTDAFSRDEVSHLMTLADQVAISIVAATDQELINLQQTAINAAANAVVITDVQGTVLWVNPAFVELTGYAPHEIVGQNPRILRSGVHSEFFYREMWETIKAGQVWQGEFYNRRKDGSVYIDEQTVTPVKNASGAITHFVGIKQDVTERKRYEEQLQFMANHDPLTDLYNRRALLEQLNRIVTLHRVIRGRPGTLLLLDVDKFKVVNDTMGHAAGDQLLMALSHVLRMNLRSQDFVARSGGDEFAVILDDTDIDQATRVANWLLEKIGDGRFLIQDKRFALGVSIGIAAIDSSLGADEILALADSALYEAKEMGRNRVVVHRSKEARGQACADAVQMATHVRDALRDNRFRLHYQPVVMLAGGKRDHHEVLVRMVDEMGTILPPDSFIPVAEHFGLMPALDRWVVNAAIEVLERDPSVTLFVNLSGHSLSDDSLLDLIKQRMVSRSGLSGRLILEITETAVVHNLELARDWMLRLKQVGCRFALDDFGTGFSSFAYLRSLPAEYIKIDGSYVQGMEEDPTTRALVQAMIHVAQALGKQVIAEWVENDRHVKLLRQMGVVYGQGYFLGRPSPNY